MGRRRRQQMRPGADVWGDGSVHSETALGMTGGWGAQRRRGSGDQTLSGSFTGAKQPGMTWTVSTQTSVGPVLAT
jgi:hypothetical protein